jgi:hypothetical protein
MRLTRAICIRRFWRLNYTSGGYPVANISSESCLAYYDPLEEAHLTGRLARFYRLVLKAVKDNAPAKGKYFFERIAPFLTE